MKKHLKKISEKLGGNLSFTSGFFFLLIGFLMAFIGSFLLFPGVFITEDFENFLPEESLIAFVSVQNLQVPEKLREKYPETEKRFSDFFSHLLGVDFAKTAEWRGKKAGIVFYENPDDVERLFSWAIFLEVDNKKVARTFLSDLAEGEVGKQGDLEVFTLKNRNSACTFFEGYAVCTHRDAQIFEKLTKKNQSITKSADYQRWSAQMPTDTYGKVFFRTEKIASLIGAPSSLLAKNITTGGFTITENGQSLDLSMFFVKSEKTAELISAKNNEAGLITVLPQDTVFFLNGKNTKNTMEATLTELSRHDPEFSVFLLGKLRALMKNRFFGEEISLEEDVFPLFTDEFILGLSKKDEKLSYFLILRGDDEIFVEAKRQKFIDGFESVSADFVPTVLSDPAGGADSAEEVFPAGDVLQKTEEEIEGGLLTTLTMTSEKGLEMAFGRRGRDLIVTNAAEDARVILQKMGMPAFKREKALIVKNFPLKTFSTFDEVFSATKEAFSYLPFPQITKELYFIQEVSGKIVRIPDAFRVDIKVDF